ncbi:hypothetical protein N781_16540 [Pontibacillus halophilus JSM 076056 = DSM 19796]|uniref:Uncharacterized protein n=1 Tax=Pontibacillus halophilus JSM 076056 = DSM 19796 TaxID=1385510 RepID=A0A0A5GMS0_9BACI|nr:hypothetical protein [Pontibacillus halophilus]KGX92493.1 hypothetical protein N781_16540 [Pontibacillus halophilus JSM 076056 = DSM 19796]
MELQENDQSLQTLTAIRLVKKSKEAYNHAATTVENGSPIAEEISQACFQICLECSNLLNAMEEGATDEMRDLGNLNKLLCEQLLMGETSLIKE